MSSVISAIKNTVPNDYMLLTMAVKRMENYIPSEVITEAEMQRRLNITQEDLDSICEVEIENLL